MPLLREPAEPLCATGHALMPAPKSAASALTPAQLTARKYERDDHLGRRRLDSAGGVNWRPRGKKRYTINSVNPILTWSQKVTTVNKRTGKKNT